MMHFFKPKKLITPADYVGVAKQLIGLSEAIKKKITDLEYSLRKYPSFFFKLPGIASKRHVEGKIQALRKLQCCILNPATTTLHLSSYSDNILDGKTLELFKKAARIHPTHFSADEKANLTNRHPISRLLRFKP